MKKIIIIIIILLTGGFLFYQSQISKTEDNSIADNLNQEVEIAEENVNEDNKNEELIPPAAEKEEKIELPKQVNIEVPFTPQAPFAIWDETHKEACEEASLLMVHKFWVKETLNKEIAEKEIQALVEFQNKNYGDFKDTDAAESAQLIKDFYGYKKVEVKYDITLDDIKKEVAEGRPVIVPAAGRLLKNPNFKQPGPLYHNLVIRGFTENEIITNDPGTRRGENYKYDPEVLMNAVHDWNKGDIYNGRKAMIVVYPN